MSRWDESRWQIRKVGKPDNGNVKEVCGADTTHGLSAPDEIDRPGLSADQRWRYVGNLRVLCSCLLAVMGIAMWEEVIGLKNDLIHSSAESLH